MACTSLEQKLKDNCKISKLDILRYVKMIVAEYGMSNKINSVKFKKGTEFLGLYSSSDSWLGINYRLLEKEYPDTITFNIEILKVIFHEIAHAIQNIQLFDNETYKKVPTYYMLMLTDYIYLANEYDSYLKKYDTFITEYEANICSFFKTLDVLTDNQVAKGLIEKTNRDFARKILIAYRNGSPISKAISLQKNFPLSHQIDNLKIYDSVKGKYKYSLANCGKETGLNNVEKILYGYPLDNDTLDILKRIRYGKIKTLNLVKEIGY